MSDYYGSSVVPTMLASAADYTASPFTDGEAPANINALLAATTILVIDATSSAYYGVDPTTGLATDPLILAAMKDANIIQAAAWDSLGIDPLTGGAVTTGVKTAKGIGTGRISYGDTAQAAAARALAAVELVPTALRRLQQQNLIQSEPWVYG